MNTLTDQEIEALRLAAIYQENNFNRHLELSLQAQKYARTCQVIADARNRDLAIADAAAAHAHKCASNAASLCDAAHNAWRDAIVTKRLQR